MNTKVIPSGAKEPRDLKAACHCRNITATIRLIQAPENYGPRACDCDFCIKHGISYVSDPQGSLSLSAEDPGAVGKYRQGSATADFIFCKKCGVVIGVTYSHQGQIFGAINVRTVEDPSLFAEPVSVSPQKLSKNEKTKRWQNVWFPVISSL